MGFPIKKRINCTDHDDGGPAPRGLDLLSAAIDARMVSDARPEPAPSSSLSPLPAQETIAPLLTTKYSGGGGEESSAAPEAVPSQLAALSRNNKRARPFPAVLRDILSDPEHESVVSWLPHGRSFAVHDTHKFSCEVLPKYYRKVVFRSFARKLNRWGFRSIKKSVSGFETTFEHNLFKRDEPELSEGMECKSNPATTKSQAAVAAGQARAASQTQAVPTHLMPHPVETPSQAVPLPTASAETHGQRPIISPISSATSIAADVSHVPGTAALVAAASALRGRRSNEEFPPFSGTVAPLIRSRGALRNALEEELAARLRDELALRELQRRAREREGEILRFLRETPASDVVSRYVAEKLRRQMLENRRRYGAY